MRGAGGTSGGTGQFFLGLVMMCGGFYLLLNSVVVSSAFGWGTRLFGFGSVGITGGIILIPLIIGVAMIFYNARSAIGWLLAVGSLAGLVFGVIASLNMHLRTMSASNSSASWCWPSAAWGCSCARCAGRRRRRRPRQVRRGCVPDRSMDSCVRFVA